MQENDAVMSEMSAVIIHVYMGNFWYQKNCRKRHIRRIMDRGFTVYRSLYLKDIDSVE
jgi:uncharacterized ferritin-like protein (DUF455 family)